jgi:hypothetical protein
MLFKPSNCKVFRVLHYVTFGKYKLFEKLQSV